MSYHGMTYNFQYLNSGQDTVLLVIHSQEFLHLQNVYIKMDSIFSIEHLVNRPNGYAEIV